MPELYRLLVALLAAVILAAPSSAQEVSAQDLVRQAVNSFRGLCQLRLRATKLTEPWRAVLKASLRPTAPRYSLSSPGIFDGQWQHKWL
ncbi:MAG: hypothetical protein ACI8QT_000350 [Halioglobus sp.]